MAKNKSSSRQRSSGAGRQQTPGGRRQQTSGPGRQNTPGKPRQKGAAGTPLIILAVGVAAAIGIAMFLSSGGEETASAALDPAASRVVDYGGGGHTRGAVNPAVTLVEYGDYECPHCAQFHPVVSELLRRLPDELALEFHHYPIPVGPNSIYAAIAAEAAGEQGRYWDMHDLLFETQRQWSGRPDAVDMFTEMAEGLGLDGNQFRQDMQSPELTNRVAADRMRGNALGVEGTPTFFINGQMLPYLPQTVDEFEDIIRSVMGQ